HHPRDAPGDRRAARRVSERRPAHHHGRHRDVRVGPRGDGARVSRAAGRRLQHRRRLLRLQPRAHPADLRGRATPKEVMLAEDVQVLADLPLAIDPDEVLRFQGYKKGVDVPTSDVRALFDDAMAEGTRLMAPRAVVRWRRARNRARDTIDVDGETLTIPR